MNKLILATLIGLIIGFAGGYFYFLNVGVDKIITRLENSDLLLQSFTGADTVNGEITSISDGEIMIIPSPKSIRSVILDGENISKVKVTDTTEFFKLVSKSEEVVSQEAEEFEDAVNPANTIDFEQIPDPPSLTEEVQVSISDLAVGDIIIVVADSNIRSGATIEATKITLSGTPVLSDVIPQRPPIENPNQ